MAGIQQVRTPAKYGGLYLGVRRRVTVPAPAAGAEWSFTIPAGGWLKLLIGRYGLTASATVASRTAMIDITDGNVVVGGGFSNASITAGQTVLFNLDGSPVQPNSAPNASTQRLPVPELWLPPGYVLQSRTGGIQVGDQYSAVELLFDELDDGLYGNDIGRHPMEPSYLLEGS